MSNGKLYLTYCYEFLTTSKCPKCDVPIFKNGGCAHMTCKSCKFEFCW